MTLTWKTLSTPAVGAVGSVKSFLTSRSRFFFSLKPTTSGAGFELVSEIFRFFTFGSEGRESSSGGGGIVSASLSSRSVSISSSSILSAVEFASTIKEDFSLWLFSITSVSSQTTFWATDECQFAVEAGSQWRLTSTDTLLVRLSPKTKNKIYFQQPAMFH
jgi:hypothetical protein